MSTPTADLVLASVAALPVLPADTPGDRYGIQSLTAAWLAQQNSPHTRRAYFRDLSLYLAWSQGAGLDPFRARPVDAGAYRMHLEGAAPRSVLRRLSAVSSWYRFLAANGAADSNPFASASRPRIDREETVTVGLTVDEVKAMLRCADQIVTATRGHAPRRVFLAHRDRAVLRVLADLGLRRAEVVSLDVDDLAANRGYRTLRYTGKGGKRRERAVAPHALHALDEYLEVRQGHAQGATAMFLTLPAGGGVGRLSDSKIFTLVRRVAVAAQIPSAERISPHSLRHAFATNARELGIALEHVQDALGHADPRTTRSYDRSRHRLNNEPGLRLGELYYDEEEDD